MRCKACNAELSAMDQSRKDDLSGEYMDLCSPCYGASEVHRWEYLDDDNIAEEAPQAPPTRLIHTFEQFVKKQGLMASWADGLGLMTEEERVHHFYVKCFKEYKSLMQTGYGTTKSLERACGIHRADRRHEFSGASFAHAEENRFNTGGSDVAITDWYE